jgi:hypothetical protein
MMTTAFQHPGPCAIRYPRGTVAGVARKAQPRAIPVGKAEVLIDGSDVAILGLGPMVAQARELARRLLYSGYSAAVVNPRFVKPLDREMLERYSRSVAAFVTFEDHVKMGGFGSAVVEALQEIGSAVPVVRIGWPDRFIEHGKVDELQARRHGGRSAVPGAALADTQEAAYFGGQLERHIRPIRNGGFFFEEKRPRGTFTGARFQRRSSLSLLRQSKPFDRFPQRCATILNRPAFLCDLFRSFWQV